MSLTLQSPPRAMGSVSMQNMSPVGFSGSSLHTNPLQQGFRGIPARAGSDEAHMWLPAVWQPGGTKVLDLAEDSICNSLTSIGVNRQGEADEEDDGEVHHVASVVRRIAIRREDSWDLYNRVV